MFTLHRWREASPGCTHTPSSACLPWVPSQLAALRTTSSESVAYFVLYAFPFVYLEHMLADTHGLAGIPCRVSVQLLGLSLLYHTYAHMRTGVRKCVVAVSPGETWLWGSDTLG